MVRTELDAILVDPLFAHSKRCQAFLRYVVEQTLEGHGTELKERTVGVEALGRPASYDTGQDPVVRTTAAEVRKRLAQYYQQHPSTTLRFVLPTGSYVPAVEDVNGEHAAVSTAAPAPARPFARRQYLVGALTVVAIVAATAVTMLVRASGRPTDVDLFWQPVLVGNGTAKIFIGPATQPAGMPPDVITMDAAGTLSRVTALLQQRGKPFEIKQSRNGAFSDLRAHPIVTIGLFNNQWTRRANEALRFKLATNDGGPLQIVDTSHDTAPRWERVFAVAESPESIVEDFALVSRVLDHQSGQWVIALGGIGTHGTAAAGEFATSPTHLGDFVASAPTGWADMNVQVVLATNVHDGVAGPPRVVASHFWP